VDQTERSLSLIFIREFYAEIWLEPTNLIWKRLNDVFEKHSTTDGSRFLKVVDHCLKHVAGMKVCDGFNPHDKILYLLAASKWFTVNDMAYKEEQQVRAVDIVIL
jgi:hypothetical protein